MSKLRDPLRFAAFVEGASHLRDEEILHFEASRHSDDNELDDSDISLNDSEDDGVRYTKSFNGYYKRIASPNNEEISEDEDEGLAYNGRTPTSMLQQQRLYRSANLSSGQKQSGRSGSVYATPNNGQQFYKSTMSSIRRRESSSAQRSTASRRSSRFRDQQEYSDEG